MSEMIDRVEETLAPFFNQEHGLYGADAREAAREVIGCLWEPTADMITAAKQFSRPISEREIWQAMLAAALEETRK